MVRVPERTKVRPKTVTLSLSTTPDSAPPLRTVSVPFPLIELSAMSALRRLSCWAMVMEVPRAYTVSARPWTTAGPAAVRMQTSLPARALLGCQLLATVHDAPATPPRSRYRSGRPRLLPMCPVGRRASPP